MSMVLPSVATIMTVPLSVTPRPRFTAPVMVRWSSSRILGMDGMRDLEGGDLLEVVAELDQWRGAEAVGVHLRAGRA